MNAIKILLSSLLFFSTFSVAAESGDRADGNVIPLWTQRQSLQARLNLGLQEETKKLDVFTFTLKEDVVGYSLLALALDIKSKGGKVRIGYDAFSSKVSPDLVAYLLLKGIDVRAFRPVDTIWSKIFSMNPFELFRYYNIRHHDKIFITEKAAILGSSNYSQDYFLISKFNQPDQKGRWNFLDRDMQVQGAALEQAQADFDAKWNKKSFWLVPKKSKMNFEIIARYDEIFEEKLKTLNNIKELGKKIPDSVDVKNVKYVADKYGPIQKDRVVHREIIKLFDSATEDIMIENPYVLLPEDVREALIRAKSRGVKVRIFTNHVGGSDEGDVNDAFKRHLRDLEAQGFDVYLNDYYFVFHGKVVVVDHKRVFWGSYNLDNRSKVMNSENGLIFESPELALQLEKKKMPGLFLPVSIREGSSSSYRLGFEARSCKEVFMDFTGESEKVNTPFNILSRMKEPLL